MSTVPEIAHSPDGYEPVKTPPILCVRSFGATDRGRVRDLNEDQFLIAVLTKALRIEGSSLPQPSLQCAEDKGYLFLVADGIGGSPAGEEASALAVQSIEEFVLKSLKWFFQLQGPEKDNVVAEFQDALRQADARIFAEAAEHPALAGMGTTLTLAYSIGANLFVANAGDSRCYLFRQDELMQLTNDHTIGQRLIAEGGLSLVPRDIRRRFHAITNAVGGCTPGVRVEVHKLGIEPGDRVLVATDGLTRELNDERIAETLRREPDARTACQRLVTRALDAGGRDNVTVIVADYEGFDGSGKLPRAV